MVILRRKPTVRASPSGVIIIVCVCFFFSSNFILFQFSLLFLFLPFTLNAFLVYFSVSSYSGSVWSNLTNKKKLVVSPRRNFCKIQSNKIRVLREKRRWLIFGEFNDWRYFLVFLVVFFFGTWVSKNRWGFRDGRFFDRLSVIGT